MSVLFVLLSFLGSAQTVLINPAAEGGFELGSTFAANGWTVVNTHLSFVPIFNLVQLKRVKNWALSLAEQTNTRALIMGDLHLPKNLPIAFSSWKSLVSANT